MRLLSLVIFITVSLIARADAYKDYIEKYSSMAIEQQEAYGIPASITLAQGLLESSAGRSRLAVKGNNHFGIKCHNEWEGDTLLRSDDAPNECFRSYSSVSESYADHSRFLQRKRYAPLYDLEVTDYASWAVTLRKCGYATDPNYSVRLIAIIERYALYLYDTESGRRSEENTDYIKEVISSTHKVRRFRKLHYVIAMPGDTYEDIAKEFGIDKKLLLTYNDVKRDGAIKDWEEVYLEPKHKKSPEGVTRATIGEGETLHSVSQRYGVQLKTLKEKNPHAVDEVGTVLEM